MRAPAWERPRVRIRTRLRASLPRVSPSACGGLRQRDVVLDHQVHRQPLDLEPGPRLEGLAALELARSHCRVDALLDLALRVDAEVLRNLRTDRLNACSFMESP